MSKSLEHLYIERHDVVDRYFLGRLAEPELAAFEEHYLHCQACLDQLETTERMVDGLEQVAAEGEPGTVDDEEDEPAGQARRITTGAGSVAAWRAWAAAASVLLALGAAYFLGSRLGPGGADGTGPSLDHPWVPSTVVTLDRLRGGGDLTRRLTLDPSASEPILLALDLNPPAGTEPDLSRPPVESYRVRLLEDERQLWAREGLQPDSRGLLLVAVPGGFLPPGEVRLEVVGEAGGTVVERVTYPLRVVNGAS